MRMSLRARWVILGFALFGLCLATASAWVHYRLLTDPTYVSPCDINQTFNCTQVYLSRFGTVRGVPVALGGVIWFSLVALVAGLHRPAVAGERDSVGGYLFALATIGLAVILYLGYASVMVLKTFCILCMGTYVCVIGIFVTAGLAASGGLAEVPTGLVGDLRRTLTKPAMLVIAILYVLGATSLLAWFPKEMRQAPATAPAAVSADVETKFTEIWRQQPRVDLGVPADGAKVVIVKFNDWMCPACKSWQEVYKPVIDKYAQANPGAVRLVYKDYPWNVGCNFKIPQTFVGHDASCVAAVAVRLARDHGKAEEMIGWLFDNQQRLGEDSHPPSAGTDEVKAHVLQLVGPGVDFDHEYAARVGDVRRDVTDGSLLNVQSTPTYYINGIRTSDERGNNMPPQYIDLAIKLELQRSAAK
jgi:uncharacterized membrane protein/protein-disulfide isomerase